MNKAFLAASVVASFAFAAPAQAVTFMLGGTQDVEASFSVTAEEGGATLTTTGVTYSGSFETAVLGTANLFRGPDGIGVCSGTETPDCPFIDDSGVSEAIRLSVTPGILGISSLVLSFVETGTIDIFGLESGGARTYLGAAGTIASPTGTGVTSEELGAGSGTYRLTFSPNLTSYQTLFLASSSDGLDGVQLTSVVGSIPEPSTWAMMLVGFGAVGYAFRRRPKYRLAQAV